jgi:hypothetical protein
MYYLCGTEVAKKNYLACILLACEMEKVVFSTALALNAFPPHQ